MTLAIIHFNWAIGGEFGYDAALPTTIDEHRIINPGKLECIIVGLGLVFFGLFYFSETGLISYQLPVWIVDYIKWIIPAIFILRAVGEFKYIGFFKRVKQTKFARWDTKLFSPLCLTIGLMGLSIEFIK